MPALENATHVLVVDDMASMRALIKATLQQAGFSSLDEAADGESAIDKIGRGRYTLIICDWDMPKKNGLEVLKFVRNDRDLKDLPFIMLTANANADLVKSAISAAVTDYVIKPFRPETLLSKIRRHLPDSAA